MIFVEYIIQIYNSLRQIIIELDIEATKTINKYGGF